MLLPPLPSRRRYGEYPQEIGIQFTDGLVHIAQVQLMSHQSKIATKIELFQGTGDDYFTCQFTRLGYLSLDSNERSQHKVRTNLRSAKGAPRTSSDAVAPPLRLTLSPTPRRPVS